MGRRVQRPSPGAIPAQTSPSCGWSVAYEGSAPLPPPPRRRGPHERPEEAVLLVIGARGEEKRIRRPVVGRALAEAERPEAGDSDRRPFSGLKWAAVLELAVAFQAPGVEGVNAPVAEVA